MFMKSFDSQRTDNAVFDSQRDRNERNGLCFRRQFLNERMQSIPHRTYVIDQDGLSLEKDRCLDAGEISDRNF